MPSPVPASTPVVSPAPAPAPASLVVHFPAALKPTLVRPNEPIIDKEDPESELSSDDQSSDNNNNREARRSSLKAKHIMHKVNLVMYQMDSVWSLSMENTNGIMNCG